MKTASANHTYSFMYLVLIAVCLGCSTPESQVQEEDTLFEGFEDPPSEARPFVRWWWNGNHIDEAEIERQLDVMHNAGLGGVEINPIAMPDASVDIGTEAKTWLSEEWNRLLVHAARQAQDRNMTVDMIVGSGWPFGGEFLDRDETIQRMIVHTLSFAGGKVVEIPEAQLIETAIEAQSRHHSEEPLSNKVHFISLIPQYPQGIDQVEDITARMEGGVLTVDVPKGLHKITYGVLQKGHREVMHGAKGAAGPVMDHYKREVTLAYLNRLEKISQDTGVPLRDIIRALFCDSIELAGANWTDGFGDIFFERYGYRLEPYFPFVFYDPRIGYVQPPFQGKAADTMKRVRYDYNKLLVQVFLDNFTRTFQEYCAENGLQARYQAYGTPFLMGMMEGNMIPDIPESNNWIYSADMDAETWTWNQGHGYMIWNVYAASGGHLTGKKVISCEAMTNTRGVFKASLEEIKQHDDMNFITGINHSVLHGYNYSPEEAGFPGWVRYGAYFSEQNTWWPYFEKWADYNARLSYVFQSSQPSKTIAIVGPTADIWAEKGLVREPFHMEPWYCYRLWESLSQAGSSCDYVSEDILVNGKVKNGLLQYGPMQYEAIIFTRVHSLSPQTAKMLMEFVGQGGKIIFMDAVPDRTPSMIHEEADDALVREVMRDLLEIHDEKVLQIEGPPSESSLLSWTEDVLQQAGIGRDVVIANPVEHVYQMHKTHGQKDLYFFVNTHRSQVVVLDCTFPVEGKTLWSWDPHTGTRSVYASSDTGGPVRLTLQPLESKLLVFDTLEGPGDRGIADIPPSAAGDRVLAGPWKLHFEHTDGTEFERTADQLEAFGTSDDAQLRSFAGTVRYTATFEGEGWEKWIEIERIHKGVVEVRLNDEPIGLSWYGRPVFSTGTALQKGENTLVIVYTSVLSNYCKNLTESPTAQRWTRGYEQIPLGLEGRIFLY